MSNRAGLGSEIIHDYLSSQAVTPTNKNVITLLQRPKKLNSNAIPLRIVFDELNYFDSDWPYKDFNPDTNQWILQEGNMIKAPDEESNKVPYIFYKNPTVSVNSFIRLMQACGWEVPVMAWKFL